MCMCWPLWSAILEPNASHCECDYSVSNRCVCVCEWSGAIAPYYNHSCGQCQPPALTLSTSISFSKRTTTHSQWMNKEFNKFVLNSQYHMMYYSARRKSHCARTPFSARFEHVRKVLFYSNSHIAICFFFSSFVCWCCCVASSSTRQQSLLCVCVSLHASIWTLSEVNENLKPIFLIWFSLLARLNHVDSVSSTHTHSTRIFIYRIEHRTTLERRYAARCFSSYANSCVRGVVVCCVVCMDKHGTVFYLKKKNKMYRNITCTSFTIPYHHHDPMPGSSSCIPTIVIDVSPYRWTNGGCVVIEEVEESNNWVTHEMIFYTQRINILHIFYLFIVVSIIEIITKSASECSITKISRTGKSVNASRERKCERIRLFSFQCWNRRRNA